MNSTLQAKLHYDGKPHQKKVSMFLNQSVKKQKTEDGQVSSTTSDWQNYCDVRSNARLIKRSEESNVVERGSFNFSRFVKRGSRRKRMRRNTTLVKNILEQ